MHVPFHREKKKEELITMTATGTITIKVTYIKSTMSEDEIKRSFMKEVKIIKRRLSKIPYLSVDIGECSDGKEKE